MPSSLILSLPLLATLVAAAPDREPYGLPLEGEDAERFLKTARVVAMKPVGVGITHPYKVTLTDGNRTLKAIWKTVDEHRQEISRSKKGSFQLGFRDSYKYEIAAYQLDKLLGLRLVPPTVERTIENQTGSLQLWVEGAFTEYQRRKRNLLPEDGWRWGAQMYKVSLLNQLIYNTDTKNALNILYDPDFRVYAIDNSRSFRLYKELPAAEELRRFSRPVVARLRLLDRKTAEEKLGRWLNGGELSALMKRRELMLKWADARIAELGESVVLYED
jgi:hypothetical protein